MARAGRTRVKSCSRCSTTSAVLYRVRIEHDGAWVFVCPACLDEVKPGNPDYRYGGTWKSRKRH